MFQGYCCKSGIAMFAGRVTWNYNYKHLENINKILFFKDYLDSLFKVGGSKLFLIYYLYLSNIIYLFEN